jgi:Asp-tRNA(Asn)/Glu-tRNA(Gln) amidotransferase A subunit family amidase
MSDPADLPANYLTATDTQSLARAGKLTITDIARAHLARVAERGGQVKAWAYLDERRVIEEAARLDALVPAERGAMWGLVLGVKDVIRE